MHTERPNCRFAALSHCQHNCQGFFVHLHTFFLHLHTLSVFPKYPSLNYVFIFSLCTVTTVKSCLPPSRAVTVSVVVSTVKNNVVLLIERVLEEERKRDGLRDIWRVRIFVFDFSFGMFNLKVVIGFENNF